MNVPPLKCLSETHEDVVVQFTTSLFAILIATPVQVAMTLVSWLTLPALIFQSLSYSNVLPGTALVACIAILLHAIICAVAAGCATLLSCSMYSATRIAVAVSSCSQKITQAASALCKHCCMQLVAELRSLARALPPQLPPRFRRRRGAESSSGSAGRATGHCCGALC